MSDREDLIAGLRSDARDYGRYMRGERGELSWGQSQVRAWDAADALASTPQATPDDARKAVSDAIRNHLRVGLDFVFVSDETVTKFTDVVLAALEQATPTAEREKQATPTAEREKLAQAWDEGEVAGDANAYGWDMARQRYVEGYVEKTNPYRKAE